MKYKGQKTVKFQEKKKRYQGKIDETFKDVQAFYTPKEKMAQPEHRSKQKRQTKNPLNQKHTAITAI